MAKRKNKSTAATVLEGKDEAELERIAKESQSLISSDSVIQGACVTLLAARQLYSLALHDLESRMLELKHQADSPVAAHLINSMSDAAMKPFERHVVVDKMQKHVLPWLAATLTSEAEDDRRATKREAVKDEELRRLEKLTLPFKIKRTDDGNVMKKDRPVVLVGQQQPTLFLIRSAVQYLRTLPARPKLGKYNVLELSLGDVGFRNVSSKKNRDRSHIQVSLDRWHNRCNSVNRMNATLRDWLNLFSERRVDLLVVEDLRYLAEPAGYTITTEKHAEHMFRVVRRWANDHGMSLLAGVTYKDQEYPKTAVEDSPWEMLEVLSDIGFVTYENGEFDADYERDTHVYKINGLQAAELVDRALIEQGVYHEWKRPIAK